MDNMKDRVVLITGPARGIGAAVARRLAQEGARLSLVGLEPERLAELARELGPTHAWFECDVTRQASLDEAVAATVDQYGRIDVVVANAGIASHGTVACTPGDAMARVIEVNLGGVIRTVSATLEHMSASRGYYLLVSSAAALGAGPGLAAYAASKSGVEHFATALRLEVAHKDVDVGVVFPCWIDTDMVRDAQSDLPSFNRMLKALPGPFGKVTSLEDCTDAIVNAIRTRRRTTFIPRGLAPFAALRQLFMSGFVESLSRRRMGRILSGMESETRQTGRPFGPNCVETTRETWRGA